MRALATLLIWVLLVQVSVATPSNLIIKAKFTEPTTRYDHGILGDAIEWGAMVLTVDMCQGCQRRIVRKFTIRLPKNRVFEDLAPRLISGGEGDVNVMVVETDLALGARLALYSESGLVAATPFIGRTHRWLAPVGAGDMDGDGYIEIAYVEKPHLSKVLKIWRLRNGKLNFVTSLGGFANHKIGQNFISGGVRDCGHGFEMITADGAWKNIMATRLKDERLTTRAIGPFRAHTDFKAAMACNF